MTHTEKHIVETYSGIFDSLSAITKLELLEKLTKSIQKNTKSKEKEFFKSFGAFSSDKSPEEILKEIKESRVFKDKDFNF